MIRSLIIMSACVLLFCHVSMPSFAAESPSAVYLKYVEALNSAKSLRDLVPYVSEARAKELDTMPQDQQDQGLKLMKALMAKNVKVASEKIEGDKAFLTLTGVDPLGNIGSSGMVLLLKEKGAWKIDKENWSSSYK